MLPCTLMAFHLLTVAATGTTQPRPSVLYPAFFDAPPSQAGKSVAITGCSRGLGFVTALALAKKGARLYLLNRKSEGSNAALAELTAACAAVGGPIPIQVDCNLLSFQSVREAAAQVLEHLAGSGLDVLCCNAGIMLQPDEASADGYDITIATNVLAHFLLTRELFPALEAAAATPAGEARVVTMSSGSGFGPPGFDSSMYAAGSGGRLGGMQQAGARYHQSKLANMLFTVELDRRCREAGSHVKALACTPGVCGTDMFVHVQENFFNPGRPADLGAVPSAEDGSLGQLKCICDPTVQSGECWGPRGMAGPPERIALEPPAVCINEGSQSALWAACEAAVGTFDIGTASTAAAGGESV